MSSRSTGCTAVVGFALSLAILPVSPPIAVSVPEEGGKGDVNLSALLPPPALLRGWETAEGPTQYGTGDLYEILDGGAERYLAYGFRHLLHVRYSLGGDSLACVTVDLFDMGSELGAFGIYRSVLPETSIQQRWGAEGYRQGTLAAARNGSLYAHAEADDDRLELTEMLERILRHACGEASDLPSLPAMLAPLPPQDRVPRSERYVPANLLGHSFLPGGALASYRIGSQEARAYFSDLQTPEAAAKALARLRDHHNRLGGRTESVSGIGTAGFRHAGNGFESGIAVCSGRWIAGLLSDLPPEAQERLLLRLLENLASSVR